MLPQQGHGLPLAAGKPQRVSQWRAFDHLARPLIGARKFRPNGEIRAAFHQQLRHRKSPIIELRRRVEDGRLAADAVFIHRRFRIDLCPAIEEKPGGLKMAVFRCPFGKKVYDGKNEALPPGTV